MTSRNWSKVDRKFLRSELNRTFTNPWTSLGSWAALKLFLRYLTARRLPWRVSQVSGASLLKNSSSKVFLKTAFKLCAKQLIPSYVSIALTKFAPSSVTNFTFARSWGEIPISDNPNSICNQHNASYWFSYHYDLLTRKLLFLFFLKNEMDSPITYRYS